MALSSLYVERRREGRIAARALDGAGKRAAFALYYAPLHVLTLHHALAELPAPWREAPPARVFDLGCGTGAASAALATHFEKAPATTAIDRAGFCLAEARHTLRAFGVPFRTRRGTLPGAFPTARPGDWIVLAFVVNECGSRERELRERVAAALSSGARVLVAEPLAGPAAPWWSDWEQALAPLGTASRVARAQLALPPFLAKMDRAAGLDHRRLGVRILYGPV